MRGGDAAAVAGEPNILELNLVTKCLGPSN